MAVYALVFPDTYSPNISSGTHPLGFPLEFTRKLSIHSVAGHTRHGAVRAQGDVGLGLVAAAGEAAAEARGRRVRVVTLSMGNRNTWGVDRWNSRSTQGAERWRQEHAGCRQVREQKHTRVPNRGEEQKHTPVPGEGRAEAQAGAKQVRGCRVKMQS